MAEFITVGKADGIEEGGMAVFEVGEKIIAVARLGDGYNAFDDTCTHAQCSLAEGDLEGRIVICPCHSSEFDITTGEVLAPPATQPLQVYEVRVEGGNLQIRV